MGIPLNGCLHITMIYGSAKRQVWSRQLVCCERQRKDSLIGEDRSLEKSGCEQKQHACSFLEPKNLFLRVIWNPSLLYPIMAPILYSSSKLSDNLRFFRYTIISTQIGYIGLESDQLEKKLTIITILIILIALMSLIIFLKFISCV